MDGQRIVTPADDRHRMRRAVPFGRTGYDDSQLSSSACGKSHLPVTLVHGMAPSATHSWISVAYAEALARETGQTIVDPAKLVAPMLTRFMATDRAFKSRRMRQPTSAGDG